MLVILTETGLGSTARCCGRRRHRQANSVRVCSPTSRRVACLKPTDHLTDHTGRQHPVGCPASYPIGREGVFFQEAADAGGLPPKRAILRSLYPCSISTRVTWSGSLYGFLRVSEVSLQRHPRAAFGG